MNDDDDLQREAEWRWGNTDAWKESKKKTARYGPADWERLQRESGQLLEAMVTLMKQGTPSTAPPAMAVAELMRQHNSTWFYETSHEMHAILAQGYVEDPRFAKFYEDIAPGLSAFVSEAIIANARRAGAKVSIDDALANVRASMGFFAPPAAEEQVAQREEAKEEKKAKKERSSKRRR